MSEQTNGGVQSVERVLDLLEVMIEAKSAIALSDLAERSGLPMPTIHRLMRTLAGRSYVRQLGNKQYVLGPRLIPLGESASERLGSYVQPELGKLVDQLQESANMAVLDGDHVLYVAQVPSPHSMRMFTEVGRRVPMHNTGVGKAILAQLDETGVRKIVDRVGLPVATEHSLATVNDLLADLARIRERGYAIDDNEQEIGVRCFAVAIPGSPTPAAVSVSGPMSRVDDAFGERAVPLLQRAASVIGGDLR